MRRTAVGLYCAVVESVRPLGIDAHDCRTRNAGGLQPAGREPARRVEPTEPWFTRALVAQPEHGTARLIGVRPQLSAMGIDDGAAYGEPNSYLRLSWWCKTDSKIRSRSSAATPGPESPMETSSPSLQNRFGTDHQFFISSMLTMASIALRIRFSMTCWS